MRIGSVRRAWRSSQSLEAELLFVAGVLVLWQAVRVPLEGSVAQSLAHATDVQRLEGALGLDVEAGVIEAVSSASLVPVLEWLYANVHLPVLFGFVAAARLADPGRYPLVRSTFLLSFVPALLVIGLYPLAPPYWLPELGLGGPPTDADLVAGGALWHNSTAAAASQHFSFAVLVAAVAIWLFPRSWVAWWMVTYPVLVFFVIVGTGNHYVVDCVIGVLTLALGAVAARALHGSVPPRHASLRESGAIGLVVGYALAVWGLVSLNLTEPRTWGDDVLQLLGLAVGIALVLAVRVSAREPVTE